MRSRMVETSALTNRRSELISKLYGISATLSVGVAGVGVATAGSNPLLGAVLYVSGASYAAGSLAYYMNKRRKLTRQ